MRMQPRIQLLCVVIFLKTVWRPTYRTFGFREPTPPPFKGTEGVALGVAVDDLLEKRIRDPIKETEQEQDGECATTNAEESFKDDMDASSGGVEDSQLFIQCPIQRCNLCHLGASPGERNRGESPDGMVCDMSLSAYITFITRTTAFSVTAPSFRAHHGCVHRKLFAHCNTIFMTSVTLELALAVSPSDFG
ncbi:hypothetical protein I305_00476 [Cryptococcus gattii E566]|uniref:Uncharacterized protein n=1 Tax=Cryptococcus gattii EJB2 TaxID=1296103 RepID=A0ABR5BUV4_9TREE|nr:hypothetical protein I306_03551 [Cryptococcus gattii EJB2]KIY37378.1 hypothetical protein I305_00476 [Cryptococcus gattii E566]KJE02664.1 hypothetical protein I311_03639 [Cryptococcus gattii NT-10]